MKVEILVKQDGTWLSIDLPKGKSYCCRLETIAEETRSSLLSEMCKDIRIGFQQEDIQTYIVKRRCHGHTGTPLESDYCPKCGGYIGVD